jgi:uncharacterized membrane protein YoaK (UPF0700 family)
MLMLKEEWWEISATCFQNSFRSEKSSMELLMVMLLQPFLAGAAASGALSSKFNSPVLHIVTFLYFRVQLH